MDGARVVDDTSQVVGEFGRVGDVGNGATVLDNDRTIVVYGTLIVCGTVTGYGASFVVGNDTVILYCTTNALTRTVVNDGAIVVEDGRVVDDDARVVDDATVVVKCISNCQRDIRKN